MVRVMDEAGVELPATGIGEAAADDDWEWWGPKWGPVEPRPAKSVSTWVRIMPPCSFMQHAGLCMAL